MSVFFGPDAGTQHDSPPYTADNYVHNWMAESYYTNRKIESIVRFILAGKPIPDEQLRMTCIKSYDPVTCVMVMQERDWEYFNSFLEVKFMNDCIQISPIGGTSDLNHLPPTYESSLYELLHAWEALKIVGERLYNFEMKNASLEPGEAVWLTDLDKGLDDFEMYRLMISLQINLPPITIRFPTKLSTLYVDSIFGLGHPTMAAGEIKERLGPVDGDTEDEDDARMFMDVRRQALEDTATPINQLGYVPKKATRATNVITSVIGLD
jgi:hypothetical protein